VDARSLEFAYGPHGKPELAGDFSDCGLRFNLAHCENLALIALIRGEKIGVDLERIRILPDMGELVARFFSPRENAVFQSLPVEQQPEAFFNLWTRKEAWLKATGEGISRYLGEVEVVFLPGDAAQLLSLPECIAPQGQWSLCDLRPTGEFAAAIAVEGQIAILQCWHWDFAEGKNEQNARGL
jgi:4'-phosphopantetheinyl transferase